MHFYQVQLLLAAVSIFSIESAHGVIPTYYTAAAAPIAHAAPVYSYAPSPVSYAAPAHYAAPVHYAAQPEYIDANPSYSFKYGVNDPHTGDSKSQEETLKDGVVHGRYSLSEPDGTIRTVTYTADKVSGFNAVVDRHGHSASPVHAVPATISAAYHAVPTTYHAVPATVHAVPAAVHAIPSASYHAVPSAIHSAPSVYSVPIQYPYNNYRKRSTVNEQKTSS